MTAVPRTPGTLAKACSPRTQVLVVSEDSSTPPRTESPMLSKLFQKTKMWRASHHNLKNPDLKVWLKEFKKKYIAQAIPYFEPT